LNHIHGYRSASAGNGSAAPVLLIALALLLAPAASLGQGEKARTSSTLPDAPNPQNLIARALPQAGACQVRNLGAAVAAAGAARAIELSGFAEGAAEPAVPPAAIIVPCRATNAPNWYERFNNGPTDKPLKPKDKAWLAARNVVDPFNAVGIVGTSAIIIGADSYTPYGPGMPGFARNVGVAYTQDMTGEFFGTFLIPSIFHQNPHYRRMPGATFWRRIGNTVTQVFWSQGDDGKGMLNYANIIGFAIDDVIGNLYVPGRATNLPATATRYGTTFLFAPTNNLVSEFLPDVAGRINFHYVILQRIINQVAKPEGAGMP
jgi:hypothetical protein